MRYLLLLVMFFSAGLTAKEDHSELKKRLEAAFPRATITAVDIIPVSGLLQVTFNGRERLYVTEDGRYMFSGDLFELQPDGKLVNLAEKGMEATRRAALEELDPKQVITYPAKGEKAEVYVFTDVTCGYCRRFHQQMEAYNQRGITVHYLAFPRGGMGNTASETMRAVWCASDRREALTAAKLKDESAVPPPGCNDPVSEQYELGLDFGVRGTPAVYTAKGEYLGGYIKPDELAAELGLAAPAK